MLHIGVICSEKILGGMGNWAGWKFQVQFIGGRPRMDFKFI